MDFPHVDERTEERFTRLWPTVEDNVKVKEAAKAAPDMLRFSREGEGPHYRLYENRIPAGMDADKSFGAWATDEAKSASLAESAAKRAGKEIGERQQRETAEQRYPAEVRYYPAVDAEEGKNRDAFNKVVGEIAQARGLDRKDVVQYNPAQQVKAFVSKVGPLPELAYWQSDEAKSAWNREGEKLKVESERSASRAGEVVERSAKKAEGREFLANHGKGLLMPFKKNEQAREATMAEIKAASFEDLQAVRDVSEREFRALERKRYGIQISAAQKLDPDLKKEVFDKMTPDDRLKAAGEADLPRDELFRLVRVKDGFFIVNQELRDRGEHLSVQEARDLKSKGEVVEQSKPVDEKGQSKKAEQPEKAAEPTGQGRQSSKGREAAAALAAGFGRGR